MVPKVIHIPSRSSAYTERWVSGWLTYSKEPKQIGPLVQVSIFKVDGAGSFPQTAPIDEAGTRQIPGSSTPG